MYMCGTEAGRIIATWSTPLLRVERLAGLFKKWNFQCWKVLVGVGVVGNILAYAIHFFPVYLTMDINNNAYSYCFCWLLFTRISIPSRTRFPPRSFWHLCPSPLILQSISSQSDKSEGATEEERESGGWNKTDGPRKEGEGEKGAPGRETCVDCGRHRRRPVREVWIDWDRGPV